MKKLIEVDLAELTILRLRCACTAVIEIPVDQLGSAGDLRCPACKSDLRVTIPHTSDPLHELQRAMTRVCEHADRFTVSFALPAPPGSND